MTTELADGLAAIGRSVADATVVGAILGLLAVALRRPLRALPAALQAGLWWLVAARLLLQLAGAPALELEWLPAQPPAPRGANVETVVPIALRTDRAPSNLPPVSSFEPPLMEPVVPRAVSPVSGATTGWAAVGLVWLIGAVIALGRAASRLGARRGMLLAAAPVSEPQLLAELACARRLARVATAVDLRRSALAPTPLVSGLLRPTIVLPAAVLVGDELRLALVHELVHVRRRDALRALVPALARRLLFFHPLAWLAEREFALATEAACDAEVVRCSGAPAARYGELLLRFALPPRRAARLAATWPLAGRLIQRRLDMLLPRNRHPRRLVLAASCAALAAVALVTPVRLVAGDPPAPPAAPAHSYEEAPSPPVAGDRWESPAPRALAPPSPPLAALPALAPMPARLSLPPMPAVAALPALAPPSPPPVPELRGADWLVLADRDAQLAIHAPRWATSRADAMATSEGRPIVLLGRDGRTFVVRDEAAVDGLRQLFFEQADAARQQAELARERAHAAREQARLAMTESRLALVDSHRGERFAAAQLERMARRESERVAELERELSRLSTEGLGEAIERAHAAARELEGLERELARVRAESERERESAASERANLRARELGELTERLAQLDAERQKHEQRMAESTRELERELERRLKAIFERELASPLEP